MEEQEDAGGTTAPAAEKKGKEPKPMPMEHVRSLLRWGRMIMVGDIIYGHVNGVGWANITDVLLRRAADMAHASAKRNGVLAALEPFICVPPANTGDCSPYCSYHYHPGDDTREPHERFEGAVYNSCWQTKTIPPSAIVFDDGIYDAEGDTFKRYKSDELYGPVVSLKYSEVRDASPTPKFNEFVNNLCDAIPNPETLWHFQKVMSAILQPHVPQKFGIFLIGPTGSRKTTIATAMLCAPGGHAGMSIESLDALADDKFSVANLLGKFGNLSDDPDGMSKKATSWFKRFTGSSIQRGEFKFVQARHYPTSAKLIVACNRIPRLDDASEAILARLQVFQFERAGDADRKHKEYSQDNYKLSIPYWSDRATRAMICQWLLKGMVARIQPGAMKPPQQCIDWNMEAIASADPIRGALVANFRRTDDPAAYVTQEQVIQTLLADGIKVTGTTVATYLKSVFSSVADSITVKGLNGAGDVTVRGYKGVGRK